MTTCPAVVCSAWSTPCGNPQDPTHVLAADDYSASTDSETFDPDATQLGYAPGRRYRDSDSEEEDWPRNRRGDDEEYW